MSWASLSVCPLSLVCGLVSLALLSSASSINQTAQTALALPSSGLSSFISIGLSVYNAVGTKARSRKTLIRNRSPLKVQVRYPCSILKGQRNIFLPAFCSTRQCVVLNPDIKALTLPGQEVKMTCLRHKHTRQT